jgi:hypothetical protein
VLRVRKRKEKRDANLTVGYSKTVPFLVGFDEKRL